MAIRNDTQGGVGGYWGRSGTGQKVWVSQKPSTIPLPGNASAYYNGVSTIAPIRGSAPGSTTYADYLKNSPTDLYGSLEQGVKNSGVAPENLAKNFVSSATQIFKPPQTADRQGDQYYTTPWAFRLNTQGLGGRKNIDPEDVDNADALFGIDKGTFGYRPPIDTGSTHHAGVSPDDIGYLPDNYAYAWPEGVPLWGGVGGGGNGTGDGGAGGGEDNPYIPTWGGGGYSMRDYYRDNGLINWRI